MDDNTDEKLPPKMVESKSIAVLQDIEVRLSVEIGSTKLKIHELLSLNEGSVVELDRESTEPVDILVNGTLLARGDVVTLGERFGIRISEIVIAGERVHAI